MPSPEAAERTEETDYKSSRGSEGKAGTGADPRLLSVETVPLSEIQMEDATFQFRFSSSGTAVLSSLEHETHRQPIDLLGVEPPYRIVDGFRRIAAARALAWDSIQAFVHRGIDDNEAMRIAFTKNVVRRNLSALEKANAILHARKQGLKRRQIAALFGLSERQVNRYQEILRLPDHIQNICGDGTVSMAHAKALADFQVTNPKEWRKRIQEEKLDAKSLRRVLAQTRGALVKGRPRVFFREEKNRMRFHRFSISLDAPAAEKERVVTALRRAIQLLTNE